MPKKPAPTNTYRASKVWKTKSYTTPPFPTPKVVTNRAEKADKEAEK